MATREQILAELNTLDDESLDELYKIIKEFTHSKASAKSFMSKLKDIRIEAPEDFSKNIDHYIEEDRRADSNLC